MTFVDRTSEFNRCVELLSEGRVVPVPVGTRLKVTGLMLKSKHITKELIFVRDQLDKLFVLAHKKGMFDDSTKDINELTALCKSKLEAISQDLSDLQQQGTSGANSSTAAHFKILVETLRKTLNVHVKKFKEAMDMRSKAIKRQHERRKQFASMTPVVEFSPASRERARGNNHAGAQNRKVHNNLARQSYNPNTNTRGFSHAQNQGRQGHHPLQGQASHGQHNAGPHLSRPGGGAVGAGGGLRQRQQINAAPSHHQHQQSAPSEVTSKNPYRRANPYAKNARSYHPSAAAQGGFQSQQFYSMNDSSQRQKDAQQAAKAVATISSMWSQMTSLIADQNDMLPSIEQDVFQAEHHVTSGQNELLKYWKTVSGERALILKLFGVLLFIIFVFTYMRS